MHLTIRVAWHNNRWNGTVCSAPSHKSFSVALDRIRVGRDDMEEEQIAKHPLLIYPITTIIKHHKNRSNST